MTAPLTSAQAAVRRLKVRVVTLALLVLLSAAALVSVPVAQRQFAELPAELAAKHVTLVSQVGREIARAVDLGVPLAALRGLDDLLTATRAANPEIASLVFVPAGAAPPPGLAAVPLTAPGGAPRLTEVEGAYALRLAVTAGDGRPLGDLHVGIDRGHVARLIQDRVFDIITVMVVTAIIATELLLLLLDTMVTAPLLALQRWAEDTRAGRGAALAGLPGRGELAGFVRQLAGLSGLVHGTAEGPAGTPWLILLRHIRIALFLFVIADTLSLSFLPLFSRELLAPLWGLSEDVLVGLPIVAYWLMSAVVQLPGARLLEHMTHRRAFLVGGALSAAGSLWSALAPDMAHLLAARALAGIGLGLVFMVCQAAILTHVPPERRTMGVATFTGVFFLATFSGTAVGGIAAEHLGFRATFGLSAAIALLACAFAHVTFGASREPPRPVAVRAAEGWAAYGRLAANTRYAGLLLLAALPNRMFNVALVFFLAPLYLDMLGASKAEIGRIVGVYGLMMAFAAPLIAGFVDKRGWQVGSVVAGTLLCAVGGLAVLPFDNQWGILLAVALMGLGQAMSIPSQMTLIPVVAARNAEILGLPRLYAVFRVGERVPAFLGPILGGALVSLLGYGAAIAAYGAWLAVSAIILAIVFGAAPRQLRSKSA
ncbi:MFS transporter [Novispirillum sp. DQ9]|uniref:MFS transporter n=1 Tax=Novispirillum sp. DQ9 TaxID=3398612 RepID=UPI003C7A8FD2